MIMIVQSGGKAIRYRGSPITRLTQAIQGGLKFTMSNRRPSNLSCVQALTSKRFPVQN